MTIEDKIAALLEEAAPLRLLKEDDAGSNLLAPIVDEINRLRAMQAAGLTDLPEGAAKKAKASKAKQEGADA